MIRIKEHHLNRSFSSLPKAYEFIAELESQGYKAIVRKRGKFWYVMVYQSSEKQSNPSSLIKKLRKGIRGYIKLSRGRLIIKT